MIGSVFDQEMIRFLQKYLTIQTVWPDALYDQAIDLFIAQAMKDGFKTNRLLLPSGYPVLVITWEGADPHIPALVLNHHMDVVPSGPCQEWQVDPFSGTVVDDQIIGRGIQDMKGVGVVHYFALSELKKKYHQLGRTVHLFLVPDEERGGFEGTKLFVESDFFKKLSIEWVFDEGAPSGCKDFLYVWFSERRPLQIKVTFTEKVAHASRLMHENPAHTLISFLSELQSLHVQNKGRAEQHGIPGAELSLHVTSLHAGTFYNISTPVLNMIPGVASATLDIRVPPALSVFEVQLMVDQIIARYPSGTYEIKAVAHEGRVQGHEHEAEMVDILNNILSEYQLHCRLYIGEGASDMRFYQEKGIKTVSFTPFCAPSMLHESNECLPISDIIQAKSIMQKLIETLCRNI